MPWINKVDTPWGNMGKVIKNEEKLWFNVEDYPSLFFFVEFKSDEEILRDLVFLSDPNNPTPSYTDLAHKLISRNAIKKEFLEEIKKAICFSYVGDPK